MKLFVSAIFALLLMNGCAFAENREIYHNQVSDRWAVSGTYNSGQLTAQLRVPRCSAQFVSEDEKQIMIIVNDMGGRFSYLILWSATWHGANTGAQGPLTMQMFFMDENNNIVDRTQAGDYVWGHDPKYYTLQPLQMAMVEYPQIDIMVHAVAESEKLKVVPHDEGMPSIELPIGHPNTLPAAWADCIHKFPQLMQQDQAKTSH